MHYQEITRESKQNLDGGCVPFCVEHVDHAEEDFLHIHDFHQLTVITHGNAVLVLNGVSYPVRAGDIYVINSFSAHYLKDMRELEFVNILFDLKDLESSCGDLAKSEEFRTLFCMQPIYRGCTRPNNIITMDYAEMEPVISMIKQMLTEQSAERTGRDQMIQSCFMMLITYLTRFQFEKAAKLPATRSYQLRQAVEYLEKNCANSVTVQDVCEACHMTQRQLRSLFERVYGCTPLQYHSNLRLQRACMYLTATDLSVSDVATLTGFEDSNYFSRKFHQEVGMTPRDYRLRAYLNDKNEHSNRKMTPD